MIRLCIHCLKHEGDPRPWVVANPGNGCTYGLGHEFPEVEKPKPPPAKKADKQLCLKCGLHPKNPASATNGCAHGYLS